MSDTYRYTGSDIAVATIDGAAYPLDPNRAYTIDDFVVTARPDLFIRSASNDDSLGEMVAAHARIAALEDDLDAHLEFAAEVLAEAGPPAGTVVEQATAAPGEKRTRTRR